MSAQFITDISNFIFVSDKPQKADAIFFHGVSHPEQPEYAANLFASKLLNSDDDIRELIDNRYDSEQIARVLCTDMNLVVIKLEALRQRVISSGR